MTVLMSLLAGLPFVAEAVLFLGVLACLIDALTTADVRGPAARGGRFVRSLLSAPAAALAFLGGMVRAVRRQPAAE